MLVVDKPNNKEEKINVYIFFIIELNFILDEIDILFIDTVHTFGHTKKELEKFIPLMNSGGIIIMHDTNNKTAFLSGRRYYSHGCIRLEDPIALAQKVLPSGIDTAYLQSCFKEQKPIDKILSQPIAVFSMYMPVFPVSATKLSFYSDVYKLTSSSQRTK